MKINIKGPIIPSNHQWVYDWLDMEATSPKKVNDAIISAQAGEKLEIEINSGGGSVFDASEIYTAIKNYQGEKKGQIVGIAASAASVIAMSVDNLSMSPTAQMMIHNATVFNEGDYRDMDHMSGILKNVNETVANAYSNKSGKDMKELLKMMDDETWLTAQQAIEHGLIDEVMFQDQAKMTASVSTEALPAAVINKIRNEFHKNDAPKPKGNVDNFHNRDPQEEEEQLKTLEELKNSYPDLFKQAKEEGSVEGAKAENARIKAIEELDIPGSEDLVAKAKYETNASAETVAMDIIKAQKAKGQSVFSNMQKDAEELNNVQGDEAPDNNKNDKQEIEKTVNLMANAVNKQRGGK